ncbi:MauE/DoxX family redox-associated membrane protein [Rossellomorea vietnamensis]|uniref:MauE/DoxX family redox-associated membrane protein n=1 Tax=Rossellomorea vietnamensis TaxID=218284 RepID=UPI003D2A5F6E
MEIITLYCSVLLSILFLSTGLDKFLHFYKHVVSTRKYDLIPARFIKIVIALMGTLELYVSIGLLIKTWKESAGLVAIVLLIIYTYAMVHQMRKGSKNLNCGCGGLIGDQEITWKSIARNAVLIMGVVVTYIFPQEFMMNSILPTYLSSILIILITSISLKMIEFKKIENVK